MVKKYFDGEIIGDLKHDALDDDVIAKFDECIKSYENYMDRYELLALKSSGIC